MVNTLIIITNDYSLLDKKHNFLNESIHISFEMDTKKISNNYILKQLYTSQLLQDSNTYFTFFIDLQSAKELIQLLKNNKNLLLRHFFHSNYEFINNMPVLGFYNEDKENNEIKNLIVLLNSILVDHGYNGVFPIYFSNENKSIDNDCNFLFTSSITNNEITSTYCELIKNNFYSSKFIGIKSLNYEDVILALIETEKKMQEEQPKLYYHLKNYKLLNIELLNLSKNLNITQLDLQNQKIYLEFYKNKDEAIKLYTFYQNEYEILPLWYKKLGHIIKVIMGKRTFRSLFDNNVKKYKN